MRIRVHVKPGSHRESFSEMPNGEFTVSVKERPRKNGANLRVQRLIADHFNVPLTAVRFITGRRGKIKTFDVIG